MEKEARLDEKVVITLIMCFAVLFMATFSPFAQQAKAVAIVDDAVIAIIITGLAVMGITFVATGGFDNINDYVQSLLEEFALDQNTTINGLLRGCNSGTDKLGRLLINNRFVILISTFAEWLIAKFNIQENQLTPVQTGGTFIGGLQCISLPVTGYTYGSYQQTEYYVEAFTSRGASPTYLLRSNFNTFFYVSTTGNIVTEEQKHYTYGQLRDTTSWDRQLTLDSGNNNGTYFNPTIYHWYETTLQYLVFAQSYDVVMPPVYTRQEIANAINGESAVIDRPAIDVMGGDIVLPEDDPTYQEGDGAIIDVGADWGLSYSDVMDDVIPNAFDDADTTDFTITYEETEVIEEAVEDTSDITNLPAGTIPITPLQLPELKLSSIWHYVAQWIADTAIAAGSLMAIVVQEPSPMVNLFYATVCLAIIFGVIKGIAK